MQELLAKFTKSFDLCYQQNEGRVRDSALLGTDTASDNIQTHKLLEKQVKFL